MSVSCRIIIGLTLELGRDLTSKDFERLHALEEMYPELDEYSYNKEDREGKLLLIYDGMSSQFARLVFVDKYLEGGNLGKGNSEIIELTAPKSCFNPEVVSKMFGLYEEYHDHRPAISDFKYAMWSQWY